MLATNKQTYVCATDNHKYLFGNAGYNIIIWLSKVSVIHIAIKPINVS